MKLKSSEVKKILKDPIKTADAANLVYATEDKLTIERHRRGRGFFYSVNGEKIKDAKAITRFKSLVIPPAWQNVRISPIHNSHLQVIGKDVKDRTQYRYHPHWEKIRNNTKFFKMSSFGKILPEIRAQVAKDLREKTMTKRKCLALVVNLMEETHIRIGNEQYAKNNKTYGLSTLRTKHLNIEKGKLLFNFVGKKGKKHSVYLENKKLQKLVMQCKEIPGWELFQYYDEEGNHHSIDSGMVNEYIQEISSDSFSAKDFRTWAASKIFLETLSSTEKPNNKTEIKKNLIDACDMAAKNLGNTRSVCRSYYVHPAIIQKYEEGSLYKYFEKERKFESNGTRLEEIEEILLDIISEYQFEIGD